VVVDGLFGFALGAFVGAGVGALGLFFDPLVRDIL
jgi:hypothetical protein